MRISPRMVRYKAAARLSDGAQDGTSILRLLGALPPQLREIIVLRECNRMSYREIAEVTGVSRAL